MKDLGRVLYFLGIQIESINSGLLLSQAQYATKILQKVGILDCKPISTTTVSKLQVLESSPPYHDLIEYKELVRSLQYLTFTRPDIAYSVNCACQHMHAPTQFHFDQVKCILWYIQNILSFGQYITSNSDFKFQTYSNAYWVGCRITRSSTNSYYTFIGANYISWSSKKQLTIYRSSMEAKYRVMAITTIEVIWGGRGYWE